MKPTGTIIIIFIAGILIALLIGGMASLFLYIAFSPLPLIPLYFWMVKEHEKKEWGQRIDHIFIIAIPPDNPDFSLEELDRFCIFEPVGNIMKRANQVEKKLRDAGNNTGAQVFVIFWQDGENRTEIEEDYKCRCIEEINLELISHHTQLEKDKEWYLTHQHKETQSYQWDKIK